MPARSSPDSWRRAGARARLSSCSTPAPTTLRRWRSTDRSASRRSTATTTACGASDSLLDAEPGGAHRPAAQSPGARRLERRLRLGAGRRPGTRVGVLRLAEPAHVGHAEHGHGVRAEAHAGDPLGLPGDLRIFGTRRVGELALGAVAVEVEHHVVAAE